MDKQIDSTAPSVEDFSDLSFRIVSEFCIKNSTFYIVPAKEFRDEKSGPNKEISQNNSYSVVGHFNFDGHHYAIISTQNILSSPEPSLSSLLTARELQISALVALGWSNKQVSNQLHISEWTVSAHLRRIFIKLKVDSRAAMVYQCASLIKHLHQFQEAQNSKS